jgi:uncharacterized protein
VRGSAKAEYAHKVPTRGVCLELLKRFRVPDHVISHSLQVERVASTLARALREKGQQVDTALVEAAALLHDITKMEGLRTGADHAKTAAQLLIGLGYPAVADVVRHHVAVRSEKGLLGVTEAEIVNYADKRVMHDRIVSLEERFEDLMHRYGRNPESRTVIASFLERTREIERKIFGALGMKPEALALLIDASP